MAKTVLYSEPGAKWRATLFGPIFAGVGFVIDYALGAGLHWVVWVAVAAMISAVVALQVTAGRKHASVELTSTTLRQGTEEVPVAEIAEVFDNPGDDRAPHDLEQWETARVLGEFAGIPNRRNGIGLRLASGSLVRAWAQDDEKLRAALAEALSTISG